MSSASKLHSSNLLRTINHKESINSVEDIEHPKLSKNLEEIGMKYINNTNNNNTHNLHYLHNHNHIHIHNHSHIHKLNFSNCNDDENSCKMFNREQDIKEENYVDEKIKDLCNIFKMQDCGRNINQNMQRNNEHNLNKDRYAINISTSHDKKPSFSILDLLNVSSQINCLFMINKEFDLCKVYYDYVKSNNEDNHK